MSGFGVDQLWCGTSLLNFSSSDRASPLPPRLSSADALTATAQLLLLLLLLPGCLSGRYIHVCPACPCMHVHAHLPCAARCRRKEMRAVKEGRVLIVNGNHMFNR